MWTFGSQRSMQLGVRNWIDKVVKCHISERKLSMARNSMLLLIITNFFNHFTGCARASNTIQFSHMLFILLFGRSDLKTALNRVSLLFCLQIQFLDQ